MEPEDKKNGWLPRVLRYPRGELARPGDRALAALALCLTVVGTLAMPLAAALGSEIYAGQTRLAQYEQDTRHRATATLLADAPPVTAGIGNGSRSVPTRAQWTLADGSTADGLIDVARGSKAGSDVPIWLDQAGRPVGPPGTSANAAAEAISVAVLCWLSVLTMCALLYGTTRWLVYRARYAAWEREWVKLDQGRTRT